MSKRGEIKIDVESALDKASLRRVGREAEALLELVKTDLDVTTDLDEDSVERTDRQLTRLLKSFNSNIRVNPSLDEKDVATLEKELSQTLKLFKESIAVGAQLDGKSLADLERRVREFVTFTEVTNDIDLKLKVDRSSLLNLTSLKTQIFSDPQAAILKLTAAFAGLVGVVGPLGPSLVGIAAGAVAAGGVLLSLGAAAGVAAIGFSGFLAGVKNGGAALDKLSPSAKAAALAVRGLHAPFHDLQQSVQEGIFKGLAGDIKNLSKTITGGLKPGFDAMAHSINTIISGFLKWSTSTKGISQINTLVSGLAKAFDALAPGISGLGKGLFNTFIQALPAIQDMSESLGRAGQRFGEFAARKDSMKDFFGTIKVLAQTFRDLGSVLGPVLGPLVDAFVVLGPSLDRVRKAILPVAQTLSKTIGEGITKLLPSIKEMGSNFAGLVEDLQPVLKILAKIFGGTIVGLIKGFVMVIDGVTTTLRGLIDFVKAVFSGEWGKAWDSVKQIFSGALKAIVGALLVWMNASFLGSFKRLFTELPALLKSGWNKALGIVKSGLSAIGNGIKGAITGYVNIWRGLFRGILNIAVNGWRVLRSAFGGAAAAIRTVVRQLVDGVKGFFSRMWIDIQSLTRRGIDKVKNFFNDLPTSIRAVGKKMLDAGKSLIGKVFEGIKRGAGAIGGFASSLATQFKHAINNALNLPLEIHLNKGPIHINATVIPKFAKGTNFAPGGLSLVGEQGPELVNLPRGSQVKTAQETERLLGRSEVNITQNFFGPTTSGGRLREMEWTARYATRARSYKTAGVAS